MTFTPIDREHWARKEYFDHYFSHVPCTYSTVFQLDITPIRRQGQKLYPTMLYHIAGEVNRREEFRTALNGARRRSWRTLPKSYPRPRHLPSAYAPAAQTPDLP